MHLSIKNKQAIEQKTNKIKQTNNKQTNKNKQQKQTQTQREREREREKEREREIGRVVFTLNGINMRVRKNDLP